MASPPYREREYLRFNPIGKPCWRCGGYASQRDHRPPLKLHNHVKGSGCCITLAVCFKCNLTEGQALSNLGRSHDKTRRVGALAPIPSVW